MQDQNIKFDPHETLQGLKANCMGNTVKYTGDGSQFKVTILASNTTIYLQNYWYFAKIPQPKMTTLERI